MGFTDESGLYRRHVHLWHILSALASLTAAYFVMGRKSELELKPGKTVPFIFGECFTDSILFLLAFAINFGMVMWVTFVAGIVMFKNLPTQTFGYIQSKLFPLYFLIGAITGFVQLAIAVYSARNIPELSWKQETVLAALVTVFVPNMINGIWIGPKSSAIMFKRHKMVKEADDKSQLDHDPDYKALRRRFGMYHGISSLLNLVALAGAAYVLYWMARMVHDLSRPKFV